jgi:exopolysaccharide biosynthesis polyprenyl glycosylphosphotransferase
MLPGMKSSSVVFAQAEKLKLLAIDSLLLLFVFLLVVKLRFEGSVGYEIPLFELIPILIIQLVSLYIFGGYEIQFSASRKQMWLRGLISTGTTVLAVVLLTYFFGKERAGLYGRGVLLGSLVGFYFVSNLYRQMVQRRYTRKSQASRWLALVSPSFLPSLKRDLQRENLLSSVEVLVCDQSQLPAELYRRMTEELKKSLSGVIVALEKQKYFSPIGESRDSEITLIQFLMDLRFDGVSLHDLSAFYENLWRKVPVYYLAPEWFAMGDGFGIVNQPIRQRLKRLFDITVSIFLLILTLPLLLLACLLIFLESPGPVVYRQVRTGKGGEDFVIYKLRSMVLNAEAPGQAQWAQEKDHRVLRSGRFFRKTRIDELPQLLNILRGQMSFVGPRPERPEFNRDLEKQIPFYDMRHLIQPGLTGWAQVMYPYGASVEDAREKLQYDLYYIKNHSPLLDFQILVRTVRVVFLGGGR